MKREGHVPCKLWQQPESTILTEYFEEVTSATKIKTILVWASGEDWCLKCFCTQTDRQTAGYVINTTAKSDKSTLYSHHKRQYTVQETDVVSMLTVTMAYKTVLLFMTLEWHSLTANLSKWHNASTEVSFLKTQAVRNTHPIKILFVFTLLCFQLYHVDHTKDIWSVETARQTKDVCFRDWETCPNWD